MQPSLEHAVERTTATFDQLSLMWGPNARLSVSVHGLPHDRLHGIGESETVYPHCNEPSVHVLTARITTPLGWAVTFFGVADSDCPRCQELLHADELAQIAGVTP